MDLFARVDAFRDFLAAHNRRLFSTGVVLSESETKRPNNDVLAAMLHDVCGAVVELRREVDRLKKSRA